MDSDEQIATNILADRLANMEEKGILVKKPHPRDKRKEVYELTEKGLDLVPILLEMATWGAAHDLQTGAPADWIEMIKADRDNIIKRIRETVRNGGSIFVGANSVISQLTAS